MSTREQEVWMDRVVKASNRRDGLKDRELAPKEGS